MSFGMRTLFQAVTDCFTGNTLENDLSNATAPAAFHDSITYGNMRKRSTSTRTSQATHWLLPAQDFRDRYEPTGSDHQTAVLAQIH